MLGASHRFLANCSPEGGRLFRLLQSELRSGSKRYRFENALAILKGVHGDHCPYVVRSIKEDPRGEPLTLEPYEVQELKLMATVYLNDSPEIVGTKNTFSTYLDEFLNKSLKP